MVSGDWEGGVEGPVASSESVTLGTLATGAVAWTPGMPQFVKLHQFSDSSALADEAQPV